MDPDRKNYNTTLRTDLVRNLRILAAHLGRRQNDLIEEAIQDLLRKYVRQAKAGRQAADDPS